MRSGCTDVLGLNYEAEALYNDGSCQYNWLDCTVVLPERADLGSCNSSILHDSVCEFGCDIGTDKLQQCMVTVELTTGLWAGEASWAVEGFPGVFPDTPYEDASHYTTQLVLRAGINRLLLVDANGDGWGAGYDMHIGNASVGSFATAADLADKWAQTEFEFIIECAPVHCYNGTLSSVRHSVVLLSFFHTHRAVSFGF